MKTQFTPGPWEVISTDKEVYDGAHVADMSNNLLVIAQSEVGCPVADAHLIAAAPELLAVAKKIKAHGTVSTSWIDELDAVINKATGGTT